MFEKVIRMLILGIRIEEGFIFRSRNNNYIFEYKLKMKLVVNCFATYRHRYPCFNAHGRFFITFSIILFASTFYFRWHLEDINWINKLSD